MKQAERGFTLLETALAGVILVVGMMLAAQLTRNNFDLVRSGDSQSVQNAAVAEQLLRAEVSLLKSYRGVPPVLAPTVASVSLGFAQLYVPSPPRAGSISSGSYTLTGYDVKVQMSQPGKGANASDPVIARTVFWQLGNTGGGSVRPGI